MYRKRLAVQQPETIETAGEIAVGKWAGTELNY